MALSVSSADMDRLIRVVANDGGDDPRLKPFANNANDCPERIKKREVDGFMTQSQVKVPKPGRTAGGVVVSVFLW